MNTQQRNASVVVQRAIGMTYLYTVYAGLSDARVSVRCYAGTCRVRHRKIYAGHRSGREMNFKTNERLYTLRTCKLIINAKFGYRRRGRRLYEGETTFSKHRLYTGCISPLIYTRCRASDVSAMMFVYLNTSCYTRYSIGIAYISRDINRDRR